MQRRRSGALIAAALVLGGLALLAAVMMLAPMRSAADREAGPRVTPTEPGTAAPATVKVLSYNMAGAVRSESEELHRDGFTVVRRLAERIAEERPQFVAVQEMCGAQFEQLKAELDKRAHPMAGAAFVPDKKSDPRCPDVPQNVPPAPGGKGVGKAVLSPDAAEAAPAGTQLNVCLRQPRETSGGPVRVCSVHTDDKVVEGAHGNRIPPLAAEAKRAVDAGEAVVLAGDFNLQPDDPGLRPVLDQGFLDAAPSGTTQARTGLPDRKIDYVFTHRDSFLKATGRGRIEDTADQCPGSGTSRCSDHHMVWAELNATSG